MWLHDTWFKAYSTQFLPVSTSYWSQENPQVVQSISQGIQRNPLILEFERITQHLFFKNASNMKNWVQINAQWV